MEFFDYLLRSVPFVAGLVGIWALKNDISMKKRSHLRDEYRFAKEFLSDFSLIKEIHHYLLEKGYQAIAGDNKLNSSEVEYLISLEKQDGSLEDYVLGKEYLFYSPLSGSMQIAFKDKFKEKWSLKWRVIWYFSLYLFLTFLTFLAFAPFILSDYFFKDRPADMAIALAVCLVSFGPYAWLSLKAGRRIKCAERLVECQRKITQSKLLAKG